MRPFLGAIGIRALPIMLDGHVGFEVKGTTYWVEQMGEMAKRNSFLQVPFDIPIIILLPVCTPVSGELLFV